MADNLGPMAWLFLPKNVQVVPFGHVREAIPAKNRTSCGKSIRTQVFYQRRLTGLLYGRNEITAPKGHEDYRRGH